MVFGDEKFVAAIPLGEHISLLRRSTEALPETIFLEHVHEVFSGAARHLADIHAGVLGISPLLVDRKTQRVRQLLGDPAISLTDGMRRINDAVQAVREKLALLESQGDFAFLERLIALIGPVQSDGLSVGKNEIDRIGLVMQDVFHAARVYVIDPSHSLRVIAKKLGLPVPHRRITESDRERLWRSFDEQRERFTAVWTAFLHVAHILGASPMDSRQSPTPHDLARVAFNNADIIFSIGDGISTEQARKLLSSPRLSTELLRLLGEKFFGEDNEGHPAQNVVAGVSIDRTEEGNFLMRIESKPYKDRASKRYKKANAFLELKPTLAD